MKKYNLHSDLKEVAKSIKKDFINDRIVSYYCNSIIRTKDDFNRIVTVGCLHAHILEKYNHEIWEK